MDKLKYIRLENPDGSYTESIPLAIDSDYVDINGKTLTKAMEEKANTSSVNNNISNLQTQINSLSSGSPAGVYDTVVALTSADPNHSKIYVVTADGHWYYYNSGWQDGGAYLSSGIDNILNGIKEDKIVIDNISFVQGGFSDGTTDFASNQRIRTSILTFESNMLYNYSALSGYSFNIAIFDNNNNYLYDTGWVHDYNFFSLSGKFRIMGRKDDNSNLSPINKNNFILSKYYGTENIKNYLYKNNNLGIASSLTSQIDKDINNGLSLSWTLGLKDSNGNINTTPTYCRKYRYSQNFNLKGKNIKIKPEAGVKIACIYLNEQQQNIGRDSGWITTETELSIDYPYVYFSATDVNNIVIDDYKLYNSRILDTNVFINPNLQFSRTYFNQGIRTSSNLRLTTLDPLFFGDNDIINFHCDSNYYCAIIPFYNGTYVADEDSGWVTDYMINKRPNITYYVTLKRSDNQEISLSEGSHLSIEYVKDYPERNNSKNIKFDFMRGFCHRCRSASDDPENTIEAAQEAFYNGQRFVEIDVRLTSDNYFVLCHDDTIDSTSNGTGKVIDKTLAELKELDFSYWGNTKIPKYEGQTVQIPTLAEMLFFCKQNNIYVVLDICEVTKYYNSSYIRDVFNEVKKNGMEKNVLWHVSRINPMRTVLGLDNDAIVIYSIGTIPSDLSIFEGMKTNRNIIGFTTQYTNYLDNAEHLEENVAIVKDGIEKGLIFFAYTINQNVINQYPALLDHLQYYGFIGIGSDNLTIEPFSKIIKNLKENL